MTHTTNNDKSHKMKIATAILTTIAILCACNSHKPQSTNAEAIPVGDIPEDSTIYNPGVLIINYTRTDSVRAAMFAQVKQLNAAVIYDYDIIDAIAIRLPEPHTLSATNAEPFAPSNPSPASSTSTATASPGSTPTDNLRIQHRSTQGRPKAQHPGCSYAICAHHTILLSINTLPPPTELHCKDVLAPQKHFLRFF